MNNNLKKVKKPIILKILKIIALLLFLTTLSLSSGCIIGTGRPPDHNVINPVVISDGLGGQIIAFQDNAGEGPITNIEKIGANGKTLWQVMQMDRSQPYKAYTSSPTQLIGDRNGNTFVVWGMGDDIWINKFNSIGKPSWNNKIKLDSCKRLYKITAISDGQDGAIIGCYGERGEFWLQRIDSEGKSIWSPKYQLSNIAMFDITSDSSDNILLIYVTYDYSIYLQNIDLSGNDIWSSPTKLDTNHPIYTQKNPTTTLPAGNSEYNLWVIAKQSGEYIGGYSDTWGKNSIDRSLDIYKVNTEGNILWSKNLKSNSGDENSKVIDYATSRVISDGSGEIFVISPILSESILGKQNISLIFQRLDSSGNMTLSFDDSQSVIDNAWNMNHARFNAILDNTGKIIIVWASTTSTEKYQEFGSILRCQKLDRDGIKQWDESGAILSNDDVLNMNRNPTLISDSSGGFIVSLGNSDPIGGGYSLVWSISPDGRSRWKRMF
jgi:hypothetical protein